MINRFKPVKTQHDLFAPVSDKMREAYQALDEILVGIDQSESFVLDPEAKRILALARTHLETSSFYAIRTVALKYRDEEK